MSDVGDKTSERAQSLVNEVGDELLDLEATYRSARSALVDEDAARRRQTDELLDGGPDRSDLVRQVVDLKTQLSRQAEELAARDEHVKALRAQMVELEDRVGRGTELELQLGDVQNEVDRSRREVERFKALTDARVVERDEIASQVRLLEVEKAQLRREVEAATDELELIASERSEMRKRIQRLEAEAVRVRRDHETRQVQLAASAEERTELQKRLSAMQETHGESISRLNEAEGLIERRSNEIAHLKKRNNRLEVDLSTLTEAATQLELRTAERDKLLRRVEVLESELTAQTTEAGASKKALELLAARTTERDSLEQKVVDLETRLGDASNQMRKQRDSGAELEARTAERDASERRVAELESELRAERAEVTEWRETANLVAALTDERDALKRHVSVLQDQLDTRPAIAAVPDPRAPERRPATPLAAATPRAAAPRPDVAPTNEAAASAAAPTSLSARIAELEARMSEELDGLDPTSDAGARERLTASAVTAAVALRDLPRDPSYHSYERAEIGGRYAADDRGGNLGPRDDFDDRDVDSGYDDDVDDVWDDDDWDDDDWDEYDEVDGSYADDGYDDDAPAAANDGYDDDARVVAADDDYDDDARVVANDGYDDDARVVADDDGYDDARAADEDDGHDDVDAPAADDGHDDVDAPAADDGEAAVDDGYDDRLDRDDVDAGYDDDWDDDYDDQVDDADGPYREPRVLGSDNDGALGAAGSRDIDDSGSQSGPLRWNDDMLPAASAPTGFDEIPDDQYDAAGKTALHTLGLTGKPSDGSRDEAGMLGAVSDDGLVATPSQATLDLYAEALRDLGAGNSSSMLDKAKRGAQAIGKGEGRRRIRLPSTVRPDSAEAAHHLLEADDVVLIVDGHGMLSAGRRNESSSVRAAATIDALSTLANKYSASIEVVFDGNEIEADGSLGSRRNVRVRFARGGVGVGEVLMRLCDTFPGSQALVLASSDRRVREAARRARINLLSADQLTAALKA